MVLACIGLGLAVSWALAVLPLPVRLVYNASDSVARGWYRVGPAGGLQAGGIVLVRLPVDVAAFAAQRGYLPMGVPLLKRIGAVAPQCVCVRDGVVRIDGVAVAVVLAQDGQHRPMHAWSQCRLLAEGEVFLLAAAHPASFDSRYFGPVRASAVVGRAQPLWTWRSP